MVNGHQRRSFEQTLFGPLETLVPGGRIALAGGVGQGGVKGGVGEAGAVVWPRR